MRESLLLHSTNIVVYPNILLFMGLHYFISFAVFVVQFSRCVLNGCLLCYRRLVGTSGFEPPTSRLSGVRSNHLSYAPISSGGDEEDRTPDPLRARQVLSQLSYTPVSEAVDSRLRFPILKVHSRTFKIEQKPTEV